MKVICLQENLKSGLNIAQNIISRNLTLPILNNLLLETDEGRLKISSTNLEIGINVWVSGKIEKGGSITCPAKLLANFINNLPNKKIELDVKNNNLTIKCENHRANLRGLPADDFPIIPKIKDGLITELSVNDFKDGLSTVVGSAALSESRPEISGVLLDFGKNYLKLVATDSFRLAEKKIEQINGRVEKAQSLIVPQKTAQELIRILGEQRGNLKIYLGDNQVLFDGGDAQIISRLIEGQYPDYQQIIPKEFSTQVMVDKEVMIDTIRIAGLFSSKTNNVQFSFQKKFIETLSIDPDLGENRSQLVAEIKGKEIVLSFNYRYLLEGLANIQSPKIFLGLNNESSPIIIKPEGEENFTYLVMPIKNN